MHIPARSLATCLFTLVLGASAWTQAPGEVLFTQKISAASGGGPLGIKGYDQFGRSAAVIGDLDLDGVPDLAVGILGDDDNNSNPDTNYGGLWILFMNRDGTVKAHSKITRSISGLPLDPGDEFGRTVRELGDWNLDGIPDVMVGADKDDDNGTDKGAFYLLFLNRDGSVQEWKKISEISGGFRGDLDPNDLWGRGLRVLGDLDLDGVPEIGVGAPWDDDGGSNRGAYWILFMRRDGTVRTWNKISDWYGNFSQTLSSYGEFGFDCVVLGDRNGDGIQDLAISSPDQKTDNQQQGAVFICYMNRDGSVKQDFRIAENHGGFNGNMLDFNDEFGCAMDGIGDIDGDGIADLAVGAAKDDDGPPGSVERGSLYILFLNANATVRSYQKISLLYGRLSAQIDNGDRFGTALACPGDLNQDGINDLFVGVRFDDDGGAGAGALYFLALNDGSVMPPSADMTFDNRRGRAPHTVNFTDLSTGDVTSWEWEFGDGRFSSEQNPQMTYTQVGVKTVALTVSGPAGSDRKVFYRIIKVDPPLAPSAAFTAQNTFGMAPLAVQFEDLSSGLVSGWQWNFGDGQTSTEASPLHVYDTVGSYTVTLTVQNVTASSTTTATDLVTVTDVPPPTAEFAIDTAAGVAPLTVAFEDQSTGDITAHLWSFGDGATSTDEDPTHTYTLPGLYDVSLTLAGPGGVDVETKAGLVLVELPPAPVAAFTVDTVSGIDPLTVGFQDASIGVVTSWTWDFGDGAASSERDPSHVYTQPGLYTVALTVTGPGGSDQAVEIDRIEVLQVVRGLRDGSFEEGTPGALPDGAWTITGGDGHQVEPGTGELTDGALPTEGAQWLRVSSAGTSGGAGAGVEQSFYLDDPLSVLRLDAAFVRGSAAGDALDNDWMRVEVSDGVTTVTLFQADGFSDTPGISPVLGMPRTELTDVRADLRELFPDSVPNTQFVVRILVGNGDAGDVGPSYGLVDRLRLEQAPGTALRYGSGINPVGSLSVVSGAPVVGGQLVLGLDNPYGTQGPATAYVWMSLGAGSVLLPGTGMSAAGTDGEVLVDRGTGLLKTIIGGRWTTPGVPAQVTVVMPNSISWIGRELYVQGYLVDPRLTYGIRVGLTDALKLLVGP